jgi:hypothetical protein
MLRCGECIASFFLATQTDNLPEISFALLTDSSSTRYLVTGNIHMACMQQTQQLVVVDARYCTPKEVVLVMEENMGWKTDNFRVTDTNGTPWFK